MKNALLMLVLVTVAALSLAAVHTLVAQTQGIPPEQLGLSKTSVFDNPAPPVTQTNTSDPGDRAPAATDFPQQPPAIPHGITDFLPITAGGNWCMDCHAVEEADPGDPTPIPASHYIDYRNAPGKKRGDIAGSRFVCVSCHVSPGGNEPLVENTFGSATR